MEMIVVCIVIILTVLFLRMWFKRTSSSEMPDERQKLIQVAENELKERWNVHLKYYEEADIQVLEGVDADKWSAKTDLIQNLFHKWRNALEMIRYKEGGLPENGVPAYTPVDIKFFENFLKQERDKFKELEKIYNQDSTPSIDYILVRIAPIFGRRYEVLIKREDYSVEASVFYHPKEFTEKLQFASYIFNTYLE